MLKRILFFLFSLTSILIVIVLFLKTSQDNLSSSLTQTQVAAQANECTATDTTNWCQVQHDPQRTGYTLAILGTNFRVAWTRPFQPDKVFPQVQAIIYQGKVFVGTEGANGQSPSLYALNSSTGAQVWKFTAGGPIVSSAAVATVNGTPTVFFSSMNGVIYAVNANNGTQIWKSQISNYFGFSTSPLLDNNSNPTKILIGNRNGIFYALNPINGQVIWQYDTGSAILQTAAYNNGRVFFGAMDMNVYALNTNTSNVNGELVWKHQVNGMAFKDYWPLITAGVVLIRPLTGGNVSLVALDEALGTDRTAVLNIPQFGYQTMNGASAPPCVISDGRIVITSNNPSNPEQYGGGWGLYQIGQTTWDFLSDPVNRLGWGNLDESMAPTCSQNLVIVLHHMEANANYTGAVTISSPHVWTHIYAGYKNGQMSENTQGGGTNPGSIANGILYHISWHELIARKTN